MRISAKGRYALAAVTSMAQNYENGEYITLISIAEKLSISKIYLEQVFSLLKRGKIVNSVKGAQGGYQLARSPRDITVYDVLSSVELSLFEETEETVVQSAPEIETAMRNAAFTVLDDKVRETLQGVSLHDLVNEAERNKEDANLMFFI